MMAFNMIKTKQDSSSSINLSKSVTFLHAVRKSVTSHCLNCVFLINMLATSVPNFYVELNSVKSIRNGNGRKRITRLSTVQ
jgi:hypothetical protein